MFVASEEGDLLMAPISIQRDGIRIKGVVKNKKVLGPVLDMSLLPGVPLTFTDFCVIGLNRCGTFDGAFIHHPG